MRSGPKLKAQNPSLVYQVTTWKHGNSKCPHCMSESAPRVALALYGAFMGNPGQTMIALSPTDCSSLTGCQELLPIEILDL